MGGRTGCVSLTAHKKQVDIYRKAGIQTDRQAGRHIINRLGRLKCKYFSTRLALPVPETGFNNISAISYLTHISSKSRHMNLGKILTSK